jgi:hypothetical protein
MPETFTIAGALTVRPPAKAAVLKRLPSTPTPTVCLPPPTPAWYKANAIAPSAHWGGYIHPPFQALAPPNGGEDAGNEDAPGDDLDSSFETSVRSSLMDLLATPPRERTYVSPPTRESTRDMLPLFISENVELNVNGTADIAAATTTRTPFVTAFEGSTGVKYHVLHDFKPHVSESDVEIEFCIGEIIVKIGDEDENGDFMAQRQDGWCCLVPSNKVAMVLPSMPTFLQGVQITACKSLWKPKVYTYPKGVDQTTAFKSMSKPKVYKYRKGVDQPHKLVKSTAARRREPVVAILTSPDQHNSHLRVLRSDFRTADHCHPRALRRQETIAETIAKYSKLLARGCETGLPYPLAITPNGWENTQR